MCVRLGDSVQTSIAIARQCHLLCGLRQQVLIESESDGCNDDLRTRGFSFTLLPVPVGTLHSGANCASEHSVVHVTGGSWDAIRDSGSVVRFASSVADAADCKRETSFLDGERADGVRWSHVRCSSEAQAGSLSAGTELWGSSSTSSTSS